MLVVVLSHCVELAGKEVTLGIGFTVTLTVIGRPTQNVVRGPVGTIVKVTVTGKSFEFEKIPEIIPPEAGPEVGIEVIIPEGFVRVKLKVVPLTLLLVPNTISENATPEHSFCA